ncbi:hypothetical protein AAF712_007645 [Marasmius tenuissimus]|uniref:GmrSD restriction endonucleases N-terminal domain-containing protein n=1 Tax=Marasmius tenuissimus TaxID=585030 RepID=A0ABR2ZW47_9AGAR|nr:hypothetical protein PM082_024654 [Marasmius tenuissimus]
MDSDSELSPLSDLEYDEPTKPQKKAKASVEPFKLGKTLKTPRATTYAASALHEQISGGNIDLNPEYQRDVVWSTQKQISLIESLYRNCYVPPVIFSVRTDEDGTETRICIDGKQRLTSIHLYDPTLILSGSYANIPDTRFMSGQIPFKDPYTGQQLWFAPEHDSSTAKGPLLPEKYRSIFSNKQIVCVEYEELQATDERDIFKRVQLGVMLTAAEKFQAISTPRTDFVRYLVQNFMTPTTLGHPDIAYDHSRGRDFNMFATAIYAISKWNRKTGLNASIHHDTLRTWLSEGSPASVKYLKGGKTGGTGVPVPEGFKRDIIKTCETVTVLATTRKYNFPFRASAQIRPSLPLLEYAGALILAYAIYISPPQSSNGKVSLRTLSSLFTLLRLRLQAEHSDSRANSVFGRTLVRICLEMSRDPLGYLKERRCELDGLHLETDVPVDQPA